MEYTLTVVLQNQKNKCEKWDLSCEKAERCESLTKNISRSTDVLLVFVDFEPDWLEFLLYCTVISSCQFGMFPQTTDCAVLNLFNTTTAKKLH